MERLKVPLFRQEPDSVECGLVCLKMIYDYYDVAKSIEEFRKELPTTSVGTYAPQTGLCLLKDGFKVEIVTHNPRLVEKIDKDLTQEELLRKFEKKSTSLTEESDKLAMGYFIDFMKNNGKVTVKIPSIDDLKQEIEQKRPILVLLTNAPLTPKNIADLKGKPFGYTFHSMVVVGIDNNKVLVNDPYDNEEGGEKEYSFEEFLFAVYSSSLGDLDNGCFMKIKR